MPGDALTQDAVHALQNKLSQSNRIFAFFLITGLCLTVFSTVRHHLGMTHYANWSFLQGFYLMALTYLQANVHCFNTAGIVRKLVMLSVQVGGAIFLETYAKSSTSSLGLGVK